MNTEGGENRLQLHRACEQGAPFKVESALLSAHPEAAWRTREKEPDATPVFVTMLSELLEHTFLDARMIKLPSVSTEACEYQGCADGYVVAQSSGVGAGMCQGVGCGSV